MLKHAHFAILRSLSFPCHDLVIRDLGLWDEHLTITNDAENVVTRLIESGDLKEGQRLLYEDSKGKLTEILFENGKFIGYAFDYLAKKEKADA